MPVDFLIPTYNEAPNLPYALRSVVGWADRVFVLDSGSTDGTQQIARDMGAIVVEHAWEGYARQKNWGLDNLPFTSPWVFILDADESITPGLKDEILNVVSRVPETVRRAGYYVNRQLIFMGEPVRHCGYFPSWNLRLFKRGTARYEDRPVHEHMVLNGPDGHLRHLMHHEDRRGLEHYIAKHNRYSTLEAELIYFGDHEEPGKLVQPRFLGNAVQRRRFFKNKIYPMIPGKWLGRFVYMYVMRLGFLDGANGLRFCLLIASHELFTSLKLRELQSERRRAQREAWQEQKQRPTTRAQLAPPPPVPDRAPPAFGTPPPAMPEAATNGPTAGGRAAGAASVTNGAAAAAFAVAAPTRHRVTHEQSTWGLVDNVKRVLWMAARATLFRPSFHNWYGLRRLILRVFGAKLGRSVRIRPTVSIEIPWNLEIGDRTVVGDHAILYALGKITIGRDTIISQYAHLCAGTHDYTDPRFPLVRLPITLGDDVWVAADAFVGPGVTVGDRAVVAARATVVRDVPAGMIVGGMPAKVLKPRDPSIVPPGAAAVTRRAPAVSGDRTVSRGEAEPTDRSPSLPPPPPDSGGGRTDGGGGGGGDHGDA